MCGLIGIVGGTFDPVHNGHILPVQRLSQDIGKDPSQDVELSSIHYVLSARPPHRDAPQVSVSHRFRMLQLALEPYPLSEADDQEVRRPGPSYTVPTLINLRRLYGDRPLCLILGLDAFLGLKSWHRWREIRTLVNLLVLSRPGWEPDEDLVTVEPGLLGECRSGRVAFWSGVEVPYSSTQIRRRLGVGQDVSGQLPGKVLQYIFDNQLYGASKHE